MKKKKTFLLTSAAVSKFLDEHPGGEEVLLDVAGKNATREYEDVGHSDEADQLMAKYLIGTYDAASAPPAASNGAEKKKAAPAPGAAAGGGSGVAGYVVPIVILLACFVAAKYFNIL